MDSSHFDGIAQAVISVILEILVIYTSFFLYVIILSAILNSFQPFMLARGIISNLARLQIAAVIQLSSFPSTLKVFCRPFENVSYLM